MSASKIFSQEYGALGDTQIDEAPANFDVKLGLKVGCQNEVALVKSFFFPF